jgi:hypothetical protein
MTQSAHNNIWHFTKHSGLQNAYNQNQQASNAHSAHMLGQQQATQYNQAIMQSVMAQQQHHWMINGRTMTFDQWLDELAPGEDNALRTFLILKYKK